jgi:class 3 adenylate cyclase
MYDTLYTQAKRLRFPENIETQFRTDYHRSTLSSTRLALVLGLILFSLFGFLDVYAVPVSKNIVWLIRYTIVAPVMIIALAASYNKRLQKYIQGLMCVTVAVAGLGIVAMIAVTQEAEVGNRFYFTGLVLVSTWGYGLSRLRFWYAVLANFIIVIGYEFASIEVKQLLTSETGVVIFTMHNFFFLGANVIGMFTSYALERYARREFLQKYDIREQRDKADKLLFNMLPKGIAEKLKQGNENIAEEFDSASVLFADIVNFTPMSARFDSYEVVDMLNELFSRFDELVDKYGVEKIQVAGDGYMVAAGVPLPRVDHATVLVRLAFDMLECVKSEAFLEGKHPVEIRIGINSGPLIAGVIGQKKMVYAVWGDTVNTASRMESHGKSGKIQITRATYELVKDEFDCEYIGEIPVKGKGQMEVWHLIGEKQKK